MPRIPPSAPPAKIFLIKYGKSKSRKQLRDFLVLVSCFTCLSWGFSCTSLQAKA